MEDNEEKLYCPYCGSTHLTANKKGFGAGKALTGAVLTGGIGLLAGFIGSNKVKVTCLKCGMTFNAGQLRTRPLTDEDRQKNAKENANAGIVVLISIILFVVFFMVSC